MNVISTMPKWAQATATKLRAQEPVPGQSEKVAYVPDSPEDSDSSSIDQAIMGTAMLASMDEMEGADMAMGQPGLVVQEEVQVQYEGNVQDPSVPFTAVLQGSGDDGDVAILLETNGPNIQTIAMTNDDGVISYQRSNLVATPEGQMEGFFVAGELPV